MSAPDNIIELVDRFERNIEAYRSGKYNETQVRIEFVDPLAPRRSVGKVYVYRLHSGWEISGFYRRDENDRWHAYLMGMDAELNLLSLKVRDSDPALLRRTATDALVELTQ